MSDTHSRVRKLFIKPKLTDTEDEHRGETFMELFYDLVYVAIALKLDEFVEHEFTFQTIAITLPVYFSFWQCWHAFLFYVNRFHHDDYFHRFWHFIQLIGVFGMAYSLEQRDFYEERASFDRVIFVIFFILTRVSLLIMYTIVLITDPSLIVVVSSYMFGFFVSASVFLGSIWIPDGTLVYLAWGLGMAVEIGAFFLNFIFISKRIPKNVTHFAHRHGAFMMLSFGESVLQLLLAENTKSVRDFVVTLVGFALVYSLANMYYDAQPHSPKAHALHRGNSWGALWAWTHFLLTYSLILTGISLNLLFYEREHHLEPEAWFFSTSVGLSVFFMIVLRLSHKGFSSTKTPRLIMYSLRLLLNAFIFITPFICIRYYCIIPVVFSAVFLIDAIDAFANIRRGLVSDDKYSDE